MRIFNFEIQSLRARLINAGLKKLFILFILGTFVAPFAFSGPAHALSFAEAAAKGNAAIAELDELKTFLGKSGLKKLAKLKLSNIKAEEKTLTGDVTFLKLNWTFIASTGGSIKDTFIGFGPKKIFKFSNLFGKKPGVDLMDVMSFDNQMLLVSAADVEIESGDLTANAKATLGRFYEDKDNFTVALDQGVSMFGTFDMADSKAIADAMKFLGGKSTELQLKGTLALSVFDAILEGKVPTPTLKLSAAMPTFRPKIGGLVQLPADVKFTYTAELTKDSVAIGFEGETLFSIGREKDMNAVLSTTLKAKISAPPSMEVEMAFFKGLPWKKAFGVKWLTIEDYTMAFAVDATGKLSIGMDGTTTFGEKALGLGASVQIQAASLGIPLPESLRFEINDGPDKVGSLALSDMAAVFNTMSKAAGGKVKIPLDAVPDVAIAGTEKGQGPKIELQLTASGDAGIDMSGKLRLLGKDLATIDKAFIKADEGIEIRARSGNLKIGPIKLPSADIEVVLRVDRDAGTIPTPRVLLKSTGLSLFGSKSELDISMFLTSSSMVANQDFGDLFKFNFRAFAGVKGLDSFDDLAKADYRIMATLQSDPGKWIRESGAKAVKKAFASLKPGLDAAVKELTKAQKEVDKLNREINKQRAQVRKEKQTHEKRLKRAQDEVNKLTKTINYLTGRMNVYKGRIKSCRQTSSICTGFKLTGGSCRKKKKIWPGIKVCYKWHPIRSTCTRHATVPNYPARAVCETANTVPRTEFAWATTKRASVIAARVTAYSTLAIIKKGVEGFPVDLDPRVSGLIAAREVARGALEVAKQAVKGVGSFTDLLAKGVAAVGKPDVFALEKSSIRGSLSEGIRGKPVVLDMNFRLLGKSYKNRFGFSLTDWKFNAKQFEVIALGAATQTVVKLGKAAKIIPHFLLDKVNELYLKRQAEVDAILKKAIAANGQIKTKEGDAKLSMGKSIDLDNRVRRIKNEAATKKKIALRDKIRRIKNKRRWKQLAALRKLGNTWKKMPGAALDISAGANGSVWVVGTNHKPYTWTGKTWKKLPGGITRIDVGPKGRAWAVNKNHDIFRWNGKKWDHLPGKAWDIGVGADGTAWVIGTNKEGANYGIYRYNGFGWTKITGSAVKIDVGPKGNAWVVTKANDIFRYNGKSWVKTPGKASEISVGANGTVMVVGTDRAPYVWTGKTWKKTPGNDIENLGVDRTGAPWSTTLKKHKNAIWAFGKAGRAPAAKVDKFGGDRLRGKFLLKVKTSGKCLDKSGSNNKGVRQYQWDCNVKNGNQQFIAEYVQGDWFRIKNVNSKKCIDISGGSKGNGGKVISWDCHKGGNQKWKIVPRGGGWNSLVVQHSNKCMDIAGGKKNNKAPFHQWDCNAKNTNQLFQVLGVQ